MKTIYTIHGEEIIIDGKDYKNAIQYKWTLKTRNKYKQVYTYDKHARGYSYKKLILGLDGKITLHKNKNPLDLRRKNIIVFNNRSEFAAVVGKLPKNYKEGSIEALARAAQGQAVGNKRNSKYKGVLYGEKLARKWFSKIKYKSKIYNLGHFSNEKDAAMAYDEKALELYGPDARVNFPNIPIEKIKKRMEQLRSEYTGTYSKIISYCHQGKLQNIPKTSQYIGVCYEKKRKKCWRAYIDHNKIRYEIGRYNTEEEAALAYNKKAKELFGKKARLNVVSKASI